MYIREYLDLDFFQIYVHLAFSSFFKSIRFLRTRLYTDAGHKTQYNVFSGLSILLSYSCSHAKCTEVKNSQKCGVLVGEVGNPTTSEYLMKLVLRRTNVVDGEWQLDCRKFLKVEIPEKDDGVPGARQCCNEDSLKFLMEGS